MVECRDSEPLIHRGPPLRRPRGGTAVRVASGVVCIASLALIGIRNQTLRTPTALRGNNVVPPTISFSNEYATPASIDLGRYKWGQVVEPHRRTILSLVGELGDATFEWNVTEANMTSSWNDGTNTTHVFKTAGQWATVVVISNGIKIVEEAVMCKYVRRELRQLSADDQKKYLNALHILYTTSMEEGCERYGDNFFSADWFNRYHLGSPSAFTPWHGAPSFFTAHTMLGDYFERSLQSIDPSLAAHYWDFTIDSAMEDWTSSFFWSDAWFGPITNSSRDDSQKHIGGQWTDVIVGRVGKPTQTHNSYGLQNEPYNNNPAPHITRSFDLCGLDTSIMALPGCAELETLFNQTTMVDFDSVAETYLHLELHPMFGGMWNCAVDLHGSFEPGSNAAKMIMVILKHLNTVVMSKYYNGNVTCPGYCSLETKFEDCKCSCTGVSGSSFMEADSLEQGAWYELFEQTIASTPLETSLVEESHLVMDVSGKRIFSGVTSEENERLYEIATRLICSPPKFANFASPLGAAADPIFFPIHIAFNRMLDTMRLNQQDNQDFELLWNATEDISGYKQSMVGYALDDPLDPFDNAYGVKRQPAGTFYTNREVIGLFEPNRESVPFVWDTFAFGSGCIGP